MKGDKKPYAKSLKRSITLRLDQYSIEYFKKMAADIGIPYQALIALFLRDCAVNQRKLNMKWVS